VGGNDVEKDFVGDYLGEEKAGVLVKERIYFSLLFLSWSFF